MFNETHADALAALRRWGKRHFARAAKVREFCDRIEAAYKREMSKTVSKNGTDFGQLGDAAAMREALVQCELFLGYVSRHGHPTLNPGDKCTACNGVDELRGMVVRALAKPPRNCDVGTKQEQQDRFREFCRRYEGEGECGIGRSEAACPAFQGGRNPDCSLWWAQMPYKKGGESNGSK